MLPILASSGAKAAATAAASLAGNTLMKTVFELAKGSVSVSSLADITKPARVEPIVIIEQSLVDQPYMTSIMKLGTSIFAGYYLQAVNMLLTVNRIDTLRVLDSLNPDRSLGIGYSKAAGAVGKALPSNEHFNYAPIAFDTATYSGGLPSLEAFDVKQRKGVLFEYRQVSLEDIGDTLTGVANAAKDAEDAVKETGWGQQNGSMSASDSKIHEVENLIVGKLLSIDIGEGKNKDKLPVLVRAIPAAMPAQPLVHMLSAGTADSWAHRLFMVNTGQIRLWRDFVLGQDLVDDHFKALINDKSGVLKTILDRRRNNMKKAYQTGQVSVADASNIAVVSSETLKQAAGRLHGKIDNPAVRRAIFDNSYLILLFVVDERWQRVTVWHRGLEISSTYRFDEIEKMEKSKGPDITEMFKMFSRSMQTNL